MNTPEPGTYYTVPFEDYLRWPCLSQSTIKQARDSMAAMRSAVLGERTKVPTDDMLLGSAMHTAFLEPELMPQRVAEWKGGARRGTAWDEFRAEHEGKVILTETMHAKLVGMMRAVRAHPWVRSALLPAITSTEVSAVGTIEGALVKGRADGILPDMVVDLKKMQSGDIRRVLSTVVSFGYHIQAAVYSHLFQRSRFVLLVVEDSPPFDVVPYELSPAFIRAGDRETRDAIQRYTFCERTGVWPGRSNEPVMLEVPEWLAGDEPDWGISDGDAEEVS
jgi:hypothetical protein